MVLDAYCRRMNSYKSVLDDDQEKQQKKRFTKGLRANNEHLRIYSPISLSSQNSHKITSIMLDHKTAVFHLKWVPHNKEDKLTCTDGGIEQLKPKILIRLHLKELET